MYVLQSVGVLFIMLCLIDGVYTLYKKYIEFVSKKSGQKREMKLSFLYPGAFLIGGLLRIILSDKSVSFLLLLKDSILWGLLIVLIIYNIFIIKNRILRTKTELVKFKDIERSEGEKLFQKKNDKNNKK